MIQRTLGKRERARPASHQSNCSAGCVPRGGLQHHVADASRSTGALACSHTMPLHPQIAILSAERPSRASTPTWCGRVRTTFACIPCEQRTSPRELCSEDEVTGDVASEQADKAMATVAIIARRAPTIFTAPFFPSSPPSPVPCVTVTSDPPFQVPCRSALKYYQQNCTPVLGHGFTSHHAVLDFAQEASP